MFPPLVRRSLERERCSRPLSIKRTARVIAVAVLRLSIYPMTGLYRSKVRLPEELDETKSGSLKESG